AQCLGNVMRLNFSHFFFFFFVFLISSDNTAIPLTPSLASQCGISVKIDLLGNALIYASLQNCFVHNVDDKEFTTALHLRLHGNQLFEDEVYQVVKTCRYTPWAFREIICDHNYMEASDCSKTFSGHIPIYMIVALYHDLVFALQKRPIDAGYIITTVVFFTPEERIMKATEAHQRGYGVGNTPTRVILRSSKSALATYTQTVAGVPMKVFKTSTIFEKQWLTARVDAVAACPVVSFTPTMITWRLPQRIDPLMSSGRVQLLEVYLGINGQRLDPTQMPAKLSADDSYIIVQIPVGADGGYFKSHIQGNRYLLSYTIEPMLELFWTEDGEDTRYKVLFPITTPLLSLNLQVFDETVPKQQVFKLVLGHFAPDVALMNISFPSEVLTIAQCHARGFNIREQLSPNSSLKVFTLEVPFKDPAVLQSVRFNFIYSLHLTFGFLVLNEFAPFSHMTYLEATLEDRGLYGFPPSVSGSCDYQNFYVLVKHGTSHFNFQTMVGKRLLTPGLAQQYGYMENGTHFNLVVPFAAPDVEFEAITPTSIRTRIDVILKDPESNVPISDFSMACNFFSPLTECYPNGTITTLAVKLESVPSLNPSELTLLDPTCGPVYSDDRYAYFVFTASSCGTTRRFLPNAMLYENDISVPHDLETQRIFSLVFAPLTAFKSHGLSSRLKVSCYYDLNTTHAVSFHTRPRRSEPYAENAKGQLQVAMRLSLDDSFREFYRLEDSPIMKYLQQPLYFEVELMSATNQVSLELENCWATLDEDKTSQPRWDLIINGCPHTDPHNVVFHPVWTDARVQYPSHFKRFEVQMFAFTENEEDLSPQVFVHCDVVICDSRNPLGGICNGQLLLSQTNFLFSLLKLITVNFPHSLLSTGKRHISEEQSSKSFVTFGPVIMS
uniref:ZP domain-containing protein n=1 Tax=Neolamprologus brichardi TaxID=32507 RepID=A0A3Q4I1S0_NEOBR